MRVYATCDFAPPAQRTLERRLRRALMHTYLEFEKPVQKLRDELEALRAKATSKPSDKLTSQIADLEVKLDKLQQPTVDRRPHS